MKKSSLFVLVALFSFIFLSFSQAVRAEDTVVVGQPYYGYGGGYGPYGGGFYPGFVPYGGGFGGGYQSPNPILQTNRLVTGNPAFLGGLGVRYGGMNPQQVRQAVGTTSQVLYYPNAVNPNDAYDGPYYNYNNGNYY